MREPDHIAQYVDRERDRQLMSLSDLARRSETSKAELAHWFSGRRHLRSDKVWRVLGALRIRLYRSDVAPRRTKRTARTKRRTT